MYVSNKGKTYKLRRECDKHDEAPDIVQEHCEEMGDTQRGMICQY